ncbi:MAG: beta-lactamase [Caulobacteraceae bacterium]|nr:beta-lactamase [Caulobacteraceae bacterium]
MSETDIRGLCPPAFDMVRQAFADNFERVEELGARFVVTLDGEVVVDLIGGFADRARTRPYAEDTLTPIFSTTKAIAAILVARLVDQGRLDYRQRVADVWPEFAQNGKQDITVEQAMSHQAGLAGFREPMDPALWLDWDAICAKLAAMAPLWPPGRANGYHPVTFGYIAGEIFRRVDGRTMGRALREDIAEPFGLDLWIGLPEEEQGRVSEMMRPSSLPKFGPPNAALSAAFLTKWAQPAGGNAKAWRKAEIPSANGHATARDLALLMSALARDGSMGSRDLLSPGMTARLAAERIRGPDLVLPYEVSWAAGLMRNEPNMFYGPTPDSFGHSGWGGSCAFADPSRGLACAYVMNRQSAHLIGDPRSRRLIGAVYGAL